MRAPVPTQPTSRNLTSISSSTLSEDPLDRRWVDINIPCRKACPIMTDIPGYIQTLMVADFKRAYEINRKDNVFPGTLGRVCPRPCEDVCRHGRKGLGDPVAICFLKRSAADFGIHPISAPEINPNAKTICVIGAGPAGLTVANDLALKGYRVTILEQFDQPGGMLRYGIPEFRLPKTVVEEDIQSILNLGVTLKTGIKISQRSQLDELLHSYDAVVLSGGCMNSMMSKIPGIQHERVLWGLDFMINANQEKSLPKMSNVVVIGGGFTAVDCARMAHRLGAQKGTLAY